MEDQSPVGAKTSKSCTLMNNSLKYGLFTGLAVILLSLLLYVMDLNGASWAQYISLLVLLAGVIMGTLAFRDKCNGGYISYGRSLGSGVIISLVVGVIMSIYTYLFFSFFDPGELLKLAQVAEEKMLEKGLTDDQVDQAMSMTKMLMTPAFIAISGLFSMLLWGTIFSLLASIFIKKNDDSFEQAFPNTEN